MGKLVCVMSVTVVVMMSCGKDNAMTSPDQPMAAAPVAPTPDPEARALVALYDAMGGENWRDPYRLSWVV